MYQKGRFWPYLAI